MLPKWGKASDLCEVQKMEIGVLIHMQKWEAKEKLRKVKPTPKTQRFPFLFTKPGESPRQLPSSNYSGLMPRIPKAERKKVSPLNLDHWRWLSLRLEVTVSTEQTTFSYKMACLMDSSQKPFSQQRSSKRRKPASLNLVVPGLTVPKARLVTGSAFTTS